MQQSFFFSQDHFIFTISLIFKWTTYCVFIYSFLCVNYREGKEDEYMEKKKNKISNNKNLKKKLIGGNIYNYNKLQSKLNFMKI